MAKHSILDGDRNGICYMCNRGIPTEVHHIYFGAKNRKVSDRHGFIVHLCNDCHRGTNGVHGKYGYLVDTYLKKSCQLKYEETHTRQEFMDLIGRNYIEEDED